MMLIRYIKYIVMLLFIATNCYAATNTSIELITGFGEDDLPVLNEVLRTLHNKSVLGSMDRSLVWYKDGDLEAATSVSARIEVPFSGTISEATAHVDTAPVGSAITLDINLNGTTLWSSGKLTISDGATSGTTTTFDATTVSDDDVFTMDIDAIGSGTAGADLTVQLTIEESMESE